MNAKRVLKALPWSLLLAAALLWVFYLAAPNWAQRMPWWVYAAFVIGASVLGTRSLRRE